MLSASSTPIAVAEVVEKLGRFRPPDEVLYFDRGLIGLRQHFPDFDHWLKTLVPVVVATMQATGPDRQWSCAELIEEVWDALEIPEWMNHWHLGSLLRSSDQVTYLGRLRVVLPGVADERGRVHMRAHFEQLLREAGAPVSTEELFTHARTTMDFEPLQARAMLLRPPFLKLDEDRWGLAERDLPGGVEAAEAAEDHIETVLRRRDRGLTAHHLMRQIAPLSAAHAQWTAGMCLSVLRGNPTFRLSKGGNVGLSEWETVRVPNRMQIIASCLDEGGGRVSVEAVQARIEALYGARLPRVDITSMAWRLGGRADGEWIVRSEEGT